MVVHMAGAAVDTEAVNSTATTNQLWARISAHLPRVPGSLYDPPYIANTSAWDVRYVSISSFSRALPLRSYSTMSDRMIRRHYANDPSWDRKFTLWIGPVGAPEPERAIAENGKDRMTSDCRCQASGWLRLWWDVCMWCVQAW